MHTPLVNIPGTSQGNMVRNIFVLRFLFFGNIKTENKTINSLQFEKREKLKRGQMGPRRAPAWNRMFPISWALNSMIKTRYDVKKASAMSSLEKRYFWGQCPDCLRLFVLVSALVVIIFISSWSPYFDIFARVGPTASWKCSFPWELPLERGWKRAISKFHLIYTCPREYVTQYSLGNKTI